LYIPSCISPTRKLFKSLSLLPTALHISLPKHDMDSWTEPLMQRIY
jgi:hypothetical protein